MSNRSGSCREVGCIFTLTMLLQQTLRKAPNHGDPCRTLVSLVVPLYIYRPYHTEMFSYYTQLSGPTDSSDFPETTGFRVHILPSVNTGFAVGNPQKQPCQEDACSQTSLQKGMSFRGFNNCNNGKILEDPCLFKNDRTTCGEHYTKHVYFIDAKTIVLGLNKERCANYLGILLLLHQNTRLNPSLK